jgi:hypothetical protein
MQPTIKRRIAREWLIFLAAIPFGFLITYGAFYLGRSTTWDNLTKVNEPPTEQERPWLVQNEVESHPESPYGSFMRNHFSKPKNPGDMLNDMWPVASYQYQYYDYGLPVSRPHRLEHPILNWHYYALKLWLCILSPYLAFCFLRSIIWSVNVLRRH